MACYAVQAVTCLGEHLLQVLAVGRASVVPPRPGAGGLSLASVRLL